MLTRIIYLSALLTCILVTPVQAATGAFECYNDERDLLDDMGVPAWEYDLLPTTAAQALNTEAYVRSERLSRSGVEIIELKKSFRNANPDLPTFSEYYKAVEIPGNDDCKGIKFLRPLSAEEVVELKAQYGAPTEQTAMFLEAYAEGLVLLGGELERRAPGGMSDEDILFLAQDIDKGCPGIVGSAQAQGYSESIVVGRVRPTKGPLFSPLAFLSGPACMASAVSEHMKNFEPENDAAIAADRAADLDVAAATVELRGVETVGGAPAQHLAATGLNMPHVAEDGTKTTFTVMHSWIDLNLMTRRKMRFEGTMEAEGQTRPFYLEMELDDFRRVGNSLLHEPYRQFLRMGGMLGPKERAQLAEAQEKLAEFEAQMAAMPASQRSMMESMVGPQLAQMRSLVNNGTVEFEIITTEIIINPDFSAGAKVAKPVDDSASLVQIIQGHLATLGYNPGNTNGELDKSTVVAITQFEAANGMPVTGQATPQLAGILAAAVDAQN